MPLLVLVAASSFACLTPSHNVGNAIHCRDHGPEMELQGLRIPGIAAPCSDGFLGCPPDPGTAARDHLADLTRGHKVSCTAVGGSADGRRLVRCSVGGRDLSCAMIDDGFANGDRKALKCPAIPRVSTPDRDIMSEKVRQLSKKSSLQRLVPLYLMMINIITYLAFAADKHRADRGLLRISEIHLLLLVTFGGGIGAVLAQERLDHMRDEQPFASQLVGLIGLQFGALLGVIGFAYWPSSGL